VKNRLGESFRFVELANDVDDHMPSYVVRRITENLNRRRQAVTGSRILVLGLAYSATAVTPGSPRRVAVADRRWPWAPGQSGRPARRGGPGQRAGGSGRLHRPGPARG
jgi:hypothetical protein